MDVLGIVGSYRKGGNTDILVRKILAGVEQTGLSTKILYLADHTFYGCTGCEGCKNSCRCVIDDDMQKIYPLLNQSRGLVIGSPTYFYNVSGLAKNFLDRLYCYEFFDKNDRSIWLGLNEVTSAKYAVTATVCEQDNARDMGFAPQALELGLTALGYRIVGSVKAYGAFAVGDMARQTETLAVAAKTGEKLAKTLRLQSQVKNMLPK